MNFSMSIYGVFCGSTLVLWPLDKHTMSTLVKQPGIVCYRDQIDIEGFTRGKLENMFARGQLEWTMD